METKKVRKVCKTEARKAVKGHEKAMHGKAMKKLSPSKAKPMNQRSAGRGR
jgi:hypothetical protein